MYVELTKAEQSSIRQSAEAGEPLEFRDRNWPPDRDWVTASRPWHLSWRWGIIDYRLVNDPLLFKVLLPNIEKEKVVTKKYIPDKECGISIGDTVRVIHRCISHENGWENTWPGCMDAYVGKSFTVKGFSCKPCGGILLTDTGHKYFPNFILEVISSHEDNKTTQPNESAAGQRTEETKIMSIKSIKVESVLYITINGERQEAKEVKDHQAFNYIKQLEDEIKGLEEINHKPKKLEGEIARLKAEIMALVSFVDSRS